MSTKKGKWERKLAKSAKRNPEAIPSPPPEATIEMAKSGIPINRGNSDAMPLSRDGVEGADAIGKEFAQKGGVDSIKTDDSVRTRQTASEVAKDNPKPVPVQIDPNLGAWAQGNLEGKPKNVVGNHIRTLIRNNPAHVIPGQGAMSSRPGESFDQFRSRVLTSVMAEMHALSENPQERRVIINHSSSGNLVKAWLAAGAPDDFSIKPEVMNQPPPKPGTAERLYPDANGQWKISEMNMAGAGELPPGIYFVHHGLTPQNEQNYKSANQSQELIRQIKAYVKSNDWPRLKALAEKAIQSGRITEDQLEQTVDSALPHNENELSALPLHHMIAAASAAGPQRRKMYANAIHSASQGAMQGIPPHLGAEVIDHMRLLNLPKARKRKSTPVAAG